MWGSGQSQARSQSDNAMLHDQQHQDSLKIRLGQQVADKMNQNIFGQVIISFLIHGSKFMKLFLKVFENQHQDQQGEAEMIFQMNQMNLEMSHKNNFNRTPEPFNMSGMTEDLAGIQSQVTRDQMMVAQMQELSVGQPHCQQQHCQLIFLQQQQQQQQQIGGLMDISSLRSGFSGLQLEAQQVTMEAGANPHYTDYMEQRTQEERNTEARAKSEENKAPLFLSSLAHQALQLR